MISQIHLSNFKCFRRLDLPLAPLSLLAGLNGMGKSSVIQSLLLLRQSWRSGDLHSGRLALSGNLTDLGTGNDILFEEAEEDFIGIGLTLSNEQLEPGEQTVKLIFSYNRESDRLERFSDSRASAHDHELPSELPPFGGHFHYVFAERFGPRKMLPLSESHAREIDIGCRGEYVLHVLLEHGTKIVLAQGDPRLCAMTNLGLNLLDQVGGWLQEISPGCHLTIEAIRRGDSALGGFAFDRPGDVRTRAFRATNVGFGLSYALPVIVALLSAPKGALVLLENPEAHMHPRGQTRLGQLAARAAAAGVQVILETHSDHVMDGVRIDIRDGRLVPRSAAFHYFQRRGAEAFVDSPSIDADGRLDHWPEGFFDQHDENLAHLLMPKPRD